VLDGILEQEGVSVAIGGEIDDPSLRECALVATSYGGAGTDESLGVLGVIGPSRMDFGRIIPLVDYISTLMTGRLRA
jgi:heat-inducible transcriptional repressor